MATQVSGLLNKFKCVGGECEDTCCGHHWNVSVNKKTIQKIQQTAPDLLNLVEEFRGSSYMKQNESDPTYCKALDKDNLCTLQKKYGEDILPDTCRKFPRTFSKLTGNTFVTARLACPETMRLVLFEDINYHFTASDDSYEPELIREWVPREIGEDDVLKIHYQFLDIIDKFKRYPVEQIVLFIIKLSEQLEIRPKHHWREVVENESQKRLELMDSEEFDVQGPEKLYRYLFETNELRMLEERFKSVYHSIQQWIISSEHSSEKFSNPYLHLCFLWKTVQKKKLDNLMRRWLKASLSHVIFPFREIPFGIRNASYLLAVNFSLVRLAIMTQLNDLGEMPAQNQIVKAAQSIALSYLHGPKKRQLSFTKHFGWLSENGIRSILAMPSL